MILGNIILLFRNLVLIYLPLFQDPNVRPSDAAPASGGAFAFWFVGLQTILLIAGSICAIIGTAKVVVSLYNQEDEALKSGGDLFLGMVFCIAIYGFLSLAFRI